MVKQWAVVVCMLCAVGTRAHAQSLALTFDDGLDPDREPRAATWNKQLLDGLQSAEIQSMIFPAVSRVGGDAGVSLVEDWSRAGHAVGNHTSGHRNLGSSQTSLADFIVQVEEAEQRFGGLTTWSPMLRFPYLKEGETAAKRDGMRQWMQRHHYRPACVSVDTSDWYFNQVWLQLQATGDASQREALQRVYLEHLLNRATYYQDLAQRVLKRSPAHVMLLHVNALNAASISQIAAQFRARGWTFVSPQQAFADPLYSMAPMSLPAGESIVWSVAHERGVTGLRYPAEDSSYEEASLRAKGLIAAPKGKAVQVTPPSREPSSGERRP